MRRSLVWALALMVAGCSSAPLHNFTLTAVPAAHPVGAGSGAHPIEVADVPVPAAIDQNQIVLNEGNGQVYVTQNDQWVAPLGSLIRQALTADLQSRLGTSTVLPPGSVVPHGGLRILKLTIQQFLGSTNGRVTLQTDWALLRAGSSDVLRSGQETITTQAASGKVADIVPAMSRALGELADRIAAQIA